MKERSQARARDQNPGQMWDLRSQNGAGTLIGAKVRA